MFHADLTFLLLNFSITRVLLLFLPRGSFSDSVYQIRLTERLVLLLQLFGQAGTQTQKQRLEVANTAICWQ